MENKRDRHFTEEEIKDKIVQSAEGMEVPDSLKPENIEKKLAQKKKKRTPVYGIVEFPRFSISSNHLSTTFRANKHY